MTKAHTGHVDGFGLQAHSCGPLMPWMIRGVGYSWQAYNGSTGEELRCHPYDLNIPGDLIRAHKLAEIDAVIAIEAKRAGFSPADQLHKFLTTPDEQLAA